MACRAQNGIQWDFLPGLLASFQPVCSTPKRSTNIFEPLQTVQVIGDEIGLAAEPKSGIVICRHNGLAI
ncbi:hypothetical protein AUQ44_17705 [Vibrio cidicii]|uniref:Uncharacterized protein n=1 Tax=Vibrio cidicii TaxID=1763883 RepID=A0A151JDB9_9VIBR|nr:hypothetical protein AUQ44_17705 [Vibrio cidicii]